MRTTIAIIATLALLGCKSDERTDNSKDDQEAAGESQAEANDESKDRPPAERSDTDRLWAYAPDSAVFGLVLGDGALSTGLDAAFEAKRILSSVPRGKKLISKMVEEVSSEAPFDIFDKNAYASVGIDLGKGVAVFADNEDNVVAIFPVGDRAAFRKLSEATTEKVDGREVDRLGKGHCVQTDGVYACGDSLEVVDAVLAKKGGPLASKVAALPAELRGDIELVALLDRIPNAKRELQDLAPAITEVKTGVLSARMTRGRLAVRGWLEGKPPAKLASAIESQADTPAIRKLGGGAVSAMLLRVPLGGFGLLDEIPPELPLAGFDFRKGVVEQLTGELAFYTAPGDNPMGTTLTVAVGMKDTGPLAKAMTKLCPMANGAPGVTIKAEDGKCSAEVDPDKLPSAEAKAVLSGKMPVTLMAKDEVFTIAIGGEPRMGSASEQAGSEASQSMLEGKWHGVMWGRWADPLSGGGTLQSMLGPTLANVPDEAKAFIEMGRVAIAHLFETGLAVRLDGKGAHLLAEFTTMAADPPPAYQAYSRAVSQGIASGSPYAKELGKVGAEHQGTLAEKQAKLVDSAAPTLAYGIGIAAGIAIPAFTKYVERSKEAPPAPPAPAKGGKGQ